MRMVQLSDIHLFANPDDSLLGVKTYESFVAVLELLKRDPKKPDRIILTGDLSQDHSKKSYEHIVELLSEFNIPIYFVPGNHDDVDTMYRSLSSKNIYTDTNIILNDWNLILLNSQIPGEAGGRLDASQLDYMQECLNQHPDHRGVVIFHHQPLPVGSAWLDQYVLTNQHEFWQITQRFPQMHSIFFGHVHQVQEGEKLGVRYYSAPATCIQFMRNKDDFALENLNPGYRWIEFKDHGKIETGVIRTAHYIGEFQKDAKGYK